MRGWGVWIVLFHLGFAGLALSAESKTSFIKPVALDSILNQLNQTRKGRELIQSAEIRLKGPIQMFLIPDRLSYTDSILSRVYDPVTRSEHRERKIQVHVNVFQDTSLVLLDLAHELVHASAQPAFDPYDPNLTVVDYIRSSIEGPGGEAAAVHAECQIAVELDQLEIIVPSHRCDRYIDRMNEVPKVLSDQIVADFYRVGAAYEDFQDAISDPKHFFPHLSPKKPMLISSTGQAPYPVALIREYLGMTQIACENTKKRAGQQSFLEPKERALLERRCRKIAAPKGLNHEGL